MAPPGIRAAPRSPASLRLGVSAPGDHGNVAAALEEGQGVSRDGGAQELGGCDVPSPRSPVRDLQDADHLRGFPRVTSECLLS